MSRMSTKRRAGFTIIEIMIVVTIIGLLAVIAIPAFINSRRRSQNTAFMNDLRVLSDSVFNTYAIENGDYPPDAPPAIEPVGVGPYLHRSMNWAERTTIGGHWDWDRGASRGVPIYDDVYAGISVFEPERTRAQMLDIDQQIDDGDLQTGQFRIQPNGYIFVLE